MLGVALQQHFDIHVDWPGEVLEINRLARIDRRVPSIRFSHDDNPHLKPTTAIETDKSRYGSRDVILLVRDPRDVVVSSFHQRTRRTGISGEPGFAGPVGEFIKHPVFGVENVVRFMNVWAKNRDIPRRFMRIRYEDMHEDPEHELKRSLEFLGVSSVSDDVLRRAVSESSFSKMRALETSDALRTPRLQAQDPGDENSYKVRRGLVGNYVNELNIDDKRYVDRVVADELDGYFGYF
jgi:hypothetical protein